MCFSAFNLIISLPLILYPTYHYLLHLLSTNHKCTQPCYFLLLYKLAAQKLKEILDSLMRSSRRAITPVNCLWSYGVFPLLCYQECSI
jgi:hypothetical protein